MLPPWEAVGRVYALPGAALNLRGSRRMAWRLEGTYFENCNCDVICPCIAGFGLPADEERCVFVVAFRISAGEVDGVHVGGLGAVLVGDADRYMQEWRLGLLVDAAASE